MKRVSNKEYPFRAYLEKDDKLIGFWCRVEKRKFITTDVGQEMDASNKVIFTPKDIGFEIGQSIRFTRESESYVSIDAVDGSNIKKSSSARRGNPEYDVRLEVS
jgi:hypothetical protein